MVKVMAKHIISYVFPFSRSKALCIVGKNFGIKQYIADKTIWWKSVQNLYELFLSVSCIKETVHTQKPFTAFCVHFFTFPLVFLVKCVMNTFSKDAVTLVPRYWSITLVLIKAETYNAYLFLKNCNLIDQISWHDGLLALKTYKHF